MKLLEHQAKAIFVHHDIPVPEGWTVQSSEMAHLAASVLGCPVMIKAQVRAGGRGKAGGIRRAEDPEEAAALAGQMLGSAIAGSQVGQILVEKALDIAQELYLGITVNRNQRCLSVMTTAHGGVDIEQIARESPSQLSQIDLDAFVGLADYHVRWLANRIGLPAQLFPAYQNLVSSVYAALLASDAMLIEINPLAVTGDGELVAADAKIVIDDNALYRQDEFAPWAEAELGPREREARRQGLNYVGLDGEIGCMVNGAGLAMATMDMIKLEGSSPANFLDIGGGARGEKVTAALRILLSHPQLKAVLINVFGGITRCDEVAQGIVDALDKLGPAIPIIVRLVGTNEREGRAILAQAGLEISPSLSDAVRKAVQAARQAGGGEGS